MSTPRKGKKGSGRRSPSPRASPCTATSSEVSALAHSSAASSRLLQLQISEVVDAGLGCDEARLMMSPSAMIALALRGGELVQLEWGSTYNAISSFGVSSAISADICSAAGSVALVMSIVLTAFPSLNLAPHRVSIHPSILPCISPPCRLHLNAPSHPLLPANRTSNFAIQPST